MSFDHVFWGFARLPNNAFMGGISDSAASVELRYGREVGDTYPSDVTIHVDPTKPDKTIVGEVLRNLSCHVIVSRRLKEFLAEKDLPDVEYLPLKVYNHKNRLVQKEYFIVNPFRPQACLNIPACGFSWRAEPGRDPRHIDQFVVDESNCTSLPLLFRPEPLFSYVLIHRELAQAIDEAGFEGNFWIEPHFLDGVNLMGEVINHYRS